MVSLMLIVTKIMIKRIKQLSIEFDDNGFTRKKRKHNERIDFSEIVSINVTRNPEKERQNDYKVSVQQKGNCYC